MNTSTDQSLIHGTFVNHFSPKRLDEHIKKALAPLLCCYNHQSHVPQEKSECVFSLCLDPLMDDSMNVFLAGHEDMKSNLT